MVECPRCRFINYATHTRAARCRKCAAALNVPPTSELPAPPPDERVSAPAAPPTPATADNAERAASSALDLPPPRAEDRITEATVPLWHMSMSSSYRDWYYRERAPYKHQRRVQRPHEKPWWKSAWRWEVECEAWRASQQPDWNRTARWELIKAAPVGVIDVLIVALEICLAPILIVLFLITGLLPGEIWEGWRARGMPPVPTGRYVWMEARCRSNCPVTEEWGVVTRHCNCPPLLLDRATGQYVS